MPVNGSLDGREFSSYGGLTVSNELRADVAPGNAGPARERPRISSIALTELERTQLVARIDKELAELDARRARRIRRAS